MFSDQMGAMEMLIKNYNIYKGRKKNTSNFCSLLLRNAACCSNLIFF